MRRIFSFCFNFSARRIKYYELQKMDIRLISGWEKHFGERAALQGKPNFRIKGVRSANCLLACAGPLSVVAGSAGRQSNPGLCGKQGTAG